MERLERERKERGEDRACPFMFYVLMCLSAHMEVCELTFNNI
jgi:hypothetical protein